MPAPTHSQRIAELQSVIDQIEGHLKVLQIGQESHAESMGWLRAEVKERDREIRDLQTRLSEFSEDLKVRVAIL